MTDTRGVIDEAEQQQEDAEEKEELFENGIEFVELRKRGFSLSCSTRTLLHQLSELGWLYKQIDGALTIRSEEGSRRRRGEKRDKGKKRDKEKSQSVGMVEQSLHAELQKEMTGYFALVARLEGKLEGVEEDVLGEGEGVAKGVKGDGSKLCGVIGLKGGLTLRKLDVWTQDVRLRMRMMATLVSEVGGELAISSSSFAPLLD